MENIEQNIEQNMEKIKVGVIGAGTSVGAEIVRIILSHPMCELVAVSSTSCRNEKLSHVFPAFRGRCDLIMEEDEWVAEASDIVFNTDHPLHAPAVADMCIKEKSVLIDLNDELRFNNPEQYTKWVLGTNSEFEYDFPAIHDAVFPCIPEINRDQLPGKVIVSCPSAIAEAAVIALAPALAGGLIYPDNIAISVCLPSESESCPFFSFDNSSYSYNVHNTVYTYFTEISYVDELSATGEIENFLSQAAGTDVRVTILPTAVPIDRGLVISCRAKTTAAGSERNLRAAYEQTYASEHFIRLRFDGKPCFSGYTARTNYCDLSLRHIERTGSFVVSCSMDYLMKGTAGNAVQIMNALLNFPEHTGLEPYAAEF